MSRYGDDLRRIVGVDEIKKRLEDLEEAQKIASNRGIGYQSGSDGSTQSASGASGSSGISVPSNAWGSATAALQSASTDAARAALAGMSNSNLPTARNASDGRLDLTNILDSFADRDLQGGDINPLSFGPNLNAINGWTDCDSGKTGQVRFDSFVPPVTWVDAITPPATSGWTLGYNWNSQIGTDTVWRPTGAELATLYQDYLNGGGTGSLPADIPYVFTGLIDGAGPVNFSAHFTRFTNGPFTYTVSKLACTAGTDIACPTTAPTDPYWPVTGSFQLAPDSNGYFVGSAYDSEVPSKYSAPSSTVYMCFGSGRHAQLTAGAGDTKLLYETDASGSILAGSVIHIYDGKGQLKGYADSTNLTHYLP